MTLIPLSVLEKLECDSFLDLMEIATDHTLAVDTESGETRGMMGISIAFRTPLGLHADYLAFRHDEDNLTSTQQRRLYSIFAKSTLIFHNAGYDLLVLEDNGYEHLGRWYDTMLMNHWVNEEDKYRGGFSLDAVSKRYGGKPKNRPPEMQFIIDNWGWDSVPLSMMRMYSTNDAEITYEAWEKLIKEFRKQEFDGPIWHDVECKFVPIIARMVRRGIRIDPNFCIKEKLRGETIMRDCVAQLGFKPSSPIALEKFLIKELQLSIYKRTPAGKISFNKEAMERYDKDLERLEDSRATLVLRYRGWQKTITSNYNAYLNLSEKIVATGEWILHPQYKLHGTVTSRLSCEKPNLQQIPAESEKDWNGKLKQAFIAREGFELWEADYSQLEFRLTAAYAEDEELIAIFADNSRDLFTEMTAKMGWPRPKLKRFVYATSYGSGANHTSIVFGVSRLEAKQLIIDFYKEFPRLKAVISEAQTICRRRGYVKMWTGRRRHFSNPKEHAHKAFNAIIQGGGAEVVKRSMIRLNEEVCDENCYMVLQIHDAVVFEIREKMSGHYLPKIKKIMEDVQYDFGVTFAVDIHEWGSK